MNKNGRMTIMTVEERNAEIKRLAKEGISVKALSKKFGIGEEYISIIIGDLSRERSAALKAAKDFGYGDEVEATITAAKNSDEISKIMSKARNKMFG